MPNDQKPVLLPKQATQELRFLLRNADKLQAIVDNSSDESGPVTYEKVATKVGLAVPDLRRIIDVVLNMRRLQDRFGLSNEQLLAVVVESFERNMIGTAKDEALEQWQAAKGAFADALTRLEPNNPLILTAKAEQLAYVQQNLFTQARIITQLRPVFNDAGDEILRGVVTHELVIDYYEGQTPRRIQFAVDAADIADLKRLCERGMRKAASIKSALFSMPWYTSILGESDDS